MDYAEALSWVEKQEGGADILKAIKTRVDGILEEKRRTTRDRDSQAERVSSLESLVEHLTKITGAEGDNPESRIKSASTKVLALTAEIESLKKTLSETEQAKQTTIASSEAARAEAEAKLAALEAARAEAEAKFNRTEKDLRITDAAIASNANPNVLRTLIGDTPLSFEIASSDDGKKQVLVVQGEQKTPLTEFAHSNWTDFVPSLFPSSPQPPASPDSRLPSGNPNSKPDDQNPVRSYVKQAGFGPKKTA